KRAKTAPLHSWLIRASICGERLPELRRETVDDALGQTPHHALLVGEVAKAPRRIRFEPGAVVEEAIQRDGQHAFEPTLVMDERSHRAGQVRHEGPGWE